MYLPGTAENCLRYEAGSDSNCLIDSNFTLRIAAYYAVAEAPRNVPGGCGALPAHARSFKLVRRSRNARGGRAQCVLIDMAVVHLAFRGLVARGALALVLRHQMQAPARGNRATRRTSRRKTAQRSYATFRRKTQRRRNTRANGAHARAATHKRSAQRRTGGHERERNSERTRSTTARPSAQFNVDHTNTTPRARPNAEC